MKRNLDIARELLLKLENSRGRLYPLDFRIDGYSDEEIDYNAYLLVQDDFVDGKPSNTPDGMGAFELKARYMNHLTVSGDIFLASMGNSVL